VSRPAPSAGVALTTAGFAAATTWVALLSWRGFTDRPATFLVPLVVLAVVVAGVGGLGRAARVGTGGVLLLQALLGGMVASYAISGSPVPVGGAWADLRTAVDLAVEGAQAFAPPVPTSEADVAPLLIGGGLLCLLLVDLLAAGLRRTPLAGLPLLTIYSLPVGLVGTELTWWVFALSALGFLVLLFRQEAASVGRWGRALDHEDRTASSPALQSAGVRLGATVVGVTATALAVVVPLAVPTLDVQLLDIGRGPGGGDGIEIDNPMVDLRRDLNRGQDVPLLRMRTDDPDPSYLRISVLTRFTANEWSSGDREIPTENRPDGRVPDLTGVDGDVPRRSFDYDVEVLDDFRSTWLPTMAPVAAVRAEGDWRYDVETMDFLAADDELDTAGLRYAMTGVQLDLSAQELADATAAAGQVSAEFTELPPDMPQIIRQLANDVTASAPTRFEKAVALQDWFRENFNYSLDQVPPGNGTDELVAFLSTDEGGRTGYCEQFAAAMAVMARQLGIPARVAVGFLVPDEVEPGVFEYSAYDLHAWPELFIAGSGWVRFEPTPADRASSVPTYTRQSVDGPAEEPVSPGGRPQDDTANPGGPADEEPSAAPTEAPAAETGAGTETDGVPSWVDTALVWTGLLVLLAGLVVLPGAWRRRRRHQRLTADLEHVWAELRDSALDLGVPWPQGRSPRETASGLRPHLRGPAGPGGPFAALDTLVVALERSRYSRVGDEASATGWEVAGATVVAGLEAAAADGVRRRAAWVPRTLLRPTRVAGGAAAATERELVDHAR
jgi:transglutaminase-like putative cysteine protease